MLRSIWLKTLRIQHTIITMTSDIRQNQYASVCNSVSSWCWDVEPFTNPQSQIKFAVLLLNRPITQNISIMKNIWNNASVRITIDGGTKKWDAYINTQPEEIQLSLRNPDLITGDFDSITDEILDKYIKKGCKTIHTPDQNFTDFTKALMELNKHCQQHEIEVSHVLAIAQASGRIDQILGNIQTLYLAKEKGILSQKVNLYLISDDAISWLLAPGDHVLRIPEETRLFKNAWCSLVPVAEACESATTHGLKWNLDNSTLKFGDLVSTSNTFDGSEEVFVKCSHTLLWSMRLPSLGAP